MRVLALFCVVAATVLVGCTKKAAEPGVDDLMSALPQCANGGCNDFKKVSCAPNGDPDGMNAHGVFKCTVSYAPAAGATNDVKTEDACVVSEGGKWKVAEAGCL